MFNNIATTTLATFTIDYIFIGKKSDLPNPLYTVSFDKNGGTGTTSNEANQPPFPPERYEAGTLNMCGIIGLGAGIDFVSRYGEKINENEYELTADLRADLAEYGITVYDKEFNFTPVTSFNLSDVTPAEVDERLRAAGICVRSGLHCASLAHRTLGTHEKGTVRVSIGAFNTRRDINALLRVVKNI